MDAKEIGIRLKKLRNDKTQADVANAIGITTMAISQYENGERIPRDEIKIKLAEYFGVSIESLFYAPK